MKKIKGEDEVLKYYLLHQQPYGRLLINLKETMKEQNNNLFQVVHIKDLDCYDVILKKESYDTTTELLGILSWLHQVGVNEPDVKLRIGSKVKEEEISFQKEQVIKVVKEKIEEERKELEHKIESLNINIEI